MTNIFQANKLKERIAALLDSGAAVNILSRKTADSLGIKRNADNTNDIKLRAANGGSLR